MPGKPRYLKNDVEWEIKKRNMKYKINPDEVSMNLATRSLYLIAKYIPLSMQKLKQFFTMTAFMLKATRR